MSKRIAHSFVDQLNSRVDIVSTIHQRVPLKKAGKNMQACCPFHNEKTPSFTVSAEKQFYYCFGCGAKGGAINFLMEYEHLSFVESVETLAKENGLDVIYDNVDPAQIEKHDLLYQAMEDSASYFEKNLFSDPARSLRAYLKERGLTQNIAKDFRLGYSLSNNHIEKEFGKRYDISSLKDAGLIATGDGGDYDQFRNRLMFPIRNPKGQVIAFGARAIGDAQPKYLNSSETKLFQKSYTLYGLYETLKSNKKIEQIIVVEGYMDVIALFQHKITTAVASLGTAFTAGHFKAIRKYTQKIYICFDGDAAGRKAATRAIPNILSAIGLGDEVRIIFLPESEDPDTFVRKNGKTSFLEKMAQGTLFSEFVYQTIVSQSDLSFVEGKAEVVSRAKALFDNLEETPYKNILYRNFLERFDIDNQLFAQSESTKNIPQQQTSHPKKVLLNNNKTRESKLIRILLEYPAFARHSKNITILASATEIDCKILKNLIKFVQYNRDSSIKQFILALNHADQKRITEIKNSVGIVDKVSVSESIEARRARFLSEYSESYDLLLEKLSKKFVLST